MEKWWSDEAKRPLGGTENCSKSLPAPFPVAGKRTEQPRDLKELSTSVLERVHETKVQPLRDEALSWPCCYSC